MPRALQPSNSASRIACACSKGPSAQAARRARPLSLELGQPPRHIWRRRDAAMRAATRADPSDAADFTYSAGSTRGMCTHRSIRSRSGPDIRPAYLATTPGWQWHRPSPSPACPHGHPCESQLHNRAPRHRAGGGSSAGGGQMRARGLGPDRPLPTLPKGGEPGRHGLRVPLHPRASTQSTLTRRVVIRSASRLRRAERSPCYNDTPVLISPGD